MVKLIRQDISVSMPPDEARAIMYALGRMKSGDWKGDGAALAEAGSEVFAFFQNYFDPI